MVLHVPGKYSSEFAATIPATLGNGVDEDPSRWMMF